MAGKVNLQVTHFAATSVKKHNNCSYNNIIVSLVGFVYSIIKMTNKITSLAGKVNLQVTEFAATSDKKKHNDCSYNIISIFGFVYTSIKMTDKTTFRDRRLTHKC